MSYVYYTKEGAAPKNKAVFILLSIITLSFFFLITSAPKVTGLSTLNQFSSSISTNMIPAAIGLAFLVLITLTTIKN